VRLLLDEMIDRAVAEQLRKRGHDVLAVQDLRMAGLRGMPDSGLLAWAAEAGRAMVTYDAKDLVPVHHRMLADEAPHAGLLLVPRGKFSRDRADVVVGLLVRALEAELDRRQSDDFTSSVRWLAFPGDG